MRLGTFTIEFTVQGTHPSEPVLQHRSLVKQLVYIDFANQEGEENYDCGQPSLALNLWRKILELPQPRLSSQKPQTLLL